ncbi:hypothetical protein ACA910_005823 [Epithemia clementina (nom. ined.)]
MDLVDKTHKGFSSQGPGIDSAVTGRQADLMVLPSVFTSTKTCKRPLTPREVSHCLDVPATVTRIWKDEMFVVINKHLTHPVKVAVVLGRCVRRYFTALDNFANPRNKHVRETSSIDDQAETRLLKRCKFNVRIDRVTRGEGKTATMTTIHHAISKMQGYQQHCLDIASTMATESAVKHDKADVPTYLWDQRVAYLLDIAMIEPVHLRAFDLLRRLLLRRWRRNVLRSWTAWHAAAQPHIQRENEELWKIVCKRGIAACRHACDATFWNWERGSAPFFWRWPTEYARDVALGCSPLWIGAPSAAIERQSNLGNAHMVTLITAKLDDERFKECIAAGMCRAMMHFFAVPKGDTDVRIVYDGTKSGLNDCLYAPWFPLPDADALARTLDTAYWCVNNE